MLFFVSGILIFPLSGQNDTIDINYEVSGTINKNSSLFTEDELLELTLRFDITTFSRKKSREEYMPALLTCYFSETDSVNKEIRLRRKPGLTKFIKVVIDFLMLLFLY